MNPRWTLLLLVGLFVSSCTPDVKIFATKAPELPVDQVKTLIFEPFVDQMGAQLAVPGRSGSLISNQGVAQLLQAEVLKGIAAGGSYRIVPGTQVQGKPLDLRTTAILKAKVRYFEVNQPGADQVFFVLLAKKKGLEGLGDLAVMGTAAAIERAAESSGKGFRLPVPFVETAGALEVDFDLVRASDQSQLIPTQRVTAYWYNKWGGHPDRSTINAQMVEGFKAKGTGKLGVLDQADLISKRLQLKRDDPDAFEAAGYHLKQDPMVPLNPLAIRSRLAQQVSQKFTKKIARHEVEFQLNLASGDGAAANLIRGGAFEAAINRLESLPTPLESGDLYNLGVAYEAIGERTQAKRKFQQGQKQDPGNGLFKDGLKRL